MGPKPTEIEGDGKTGNGQVLTTWNWPLELYYGGEVLGDKATTAQDTLRVVLY